MRNLRINVLIILLAAIGSLSSCGTKYVTPDYALETPEAVRAAQPNCYEPIQSLKQYESVSTDACMDVVDCSEENAIYWEYKYFDLRERIDKAGEF